MRLKKFVAGFVLGAPTVCLLIILYKIRVILGYALLTLLVVAAVSALWLGFKLLIEWALEAIRD